MLGYRTLRKGPSTQGRRGYQPLHGQPFARSPTDPSSSTIILPDDNDDPICDTEQHQDGGGPTPLPYPAIIALCMGRFAEGLIFGVILPYINEMVHGMGVKQEDLGKWSAAAEAVMLISGALFAPLTAYLGDRFGRRWVYLISLALWGIGSVWFGVQQTLFGVIFTRSLIGIIAGPSLLSRTIMAEITDKTNAVKGFAIFSPANALGNTVGPVIGGLLARPVPGLLGPSWTLFVTYPYLLPSLAVSSFNWVVVVLAARFVPETNPLLRRSRKASDTEVEMPLMSPLSVEDTQRGKVLDDNAHADQEQRTISTWDRIKRLLGQPPFRFIMALFALVNPITTAFDVVFPLFMYTEIGLGGMGLSVRTTGQILGLTLVVGLPLNILLLPPLVARCGRKMAILLSLGAYCLSILLLPLLHRSHASTSPPGTWTASTVLLLTLYSLLRRIGDFTQTLNDALVMPSIPNAEDLATAASVVFSVRQISRGVGLYAVSYIFSVSASAAADSWLRQLWWITFLCGALPAVYVTMVRDREQIDGA